MNVRELIEHLQRFEPELQVQVFHDVGAMEIDEPTLYCGDYEDPTNTKLIRRTVHGLFVGLGNPADYYIDDGDLPEIV